MDVGHPCGLVCQAAALPVLIVGTCSSAFEKAASGKAAKALMPARSNSLFLIGWASRLARCLSAPNTPYSALEG
jgi:hypothetical protein